jgi:hypothetical protein
MKDEEIYALCKTKEGCIQYIKNNMSEGSKESYLPSKKVPLILELEKEGIVGKRIKYGVEFWHLIQK